MCAAEKRVGRAAEPKALGRGGIDQTARLGDVDAERLLGVDMLAGGQRLQADLDMCDRHGEIEDDLDGGVGQQSLDRTGAQAKFLRARLRRGRNRVRQGDDVEDGKQLRGFKIGGTDVAAANDADADSFHCSSPCTGLIADGSRPGGAPGGAIEVAERHRRGAARPDAVAPLAHDDVADVAQARRQLRSRPFRAEGRRKLARRHCSPGDDDLGRREQRDEIGDGEAERRACIGERARAALVAVVRALQQDGHRSCRREPRRRDRCRPAAPRLQRATEVLEARSARRPPPSALRVDHQVTEVGAEAIRAAEQLAVMQDAEAETVLDADDEKIVQCRAPVRTNVRQA